MAGKLIFPGRKDKTFLYPRLVPVWNCRRDGQKRAFLPPGKVTLVKENLKPTEKDCWKKKNLQSQFVSFSSISPPFQGASPLVCSSQLPLCDTYPRSILYLSHSLATRCPGCSPVSIIINYDILGHKTVLNVLDAVAVNTAIIFAQTCRSRILGSKGMDPGVTLDTWRQARPGSFRDGLGWVQPGVLSL